MFRWAVVQRVAAAWLAIVFCASPAWALEAEQEAKLLPPDGGANDEFGYRVALDGVTAVITARHGDNFSGSAWAFIRSGTEWVPQDKLLATDGSQFDEFGAGVALDGDTAIVGARLDDANGENSGSAYVFHRTGPIWTEQAKLLPTDGAGGDGFGLSVALDGDTAVVGAWHDDDNGEDSGSAYVFGRVGDTWTEQAKLLPADGSAGDEFGLSVALNGDTAIVGSYKDDDNGSSSGSAYVFKRVGGVWTEQAKFVPADGAAGDRFGLAVSLDGDTAVVSAALDDDNGPTSGSAYVFVRARGVWTQQAKLVPADGAGGDGFGASVSVAGDRTIIGAWGNDDNGSNSGSAYVFTRVAGVWTESVNLLPDDGPPLARFGSSVALDGDTAVIGAYKDSPNGVDSGSAYVFRWLPCGDGILDPDEECDDGNNISCDGCSAICEHEMGFVCGDGGLNTGCGEECDDSNNEDGDGCSADCTLEEPVPAVSHQGMIAQLLLLLTITTAILLWRRRSAA